MIIVESKRKKPATILKKYPDAILADVTSGAKDARLAKMDIAFWQRQKVKEGQSENFRFIRDS
jgi:hypothetical protein